MRPPQFQMHRKLARTPTLINPDSIKANPYAPGVDDNIFHCNTPVRKHLNVPRGNTLGLHSSQNSPPTFSNLVFPGEFPESDAKELRKILEVFEKSLTRNPEPSAFDCLVYVALLSRKYKVKRWELWAITGIKNFIHDFPLLDLSPSKIFVRLFRFANHCHDKQLLREIEDKWITRMDSNNLSPIPAILLADELDNRELLSRALYAYLVMVEPRISNSQRIDIGSPLSHQLNLHVFSGYYALQAYWTDLCDHPLEFQMAEGCTAHTDCLTTWRPRWSTTVLQQPAGVSHIDILSRLCFVEESLREDPLCTTYMSDKCRESALAAVSQKRNSLALNMHHIFDL